MLPAHCSLHLPRRSRRKRYVTMTSHRTLLQPVAMRPSQLLLLVLLLRLLLLLLLLLQLLLLHAAALLRARQRAVLRQAGHEPREGRPQLGQVLHRAHNDGQLAGRQRPHQPGTARGVSTRVRVNTWARGRGAGVGTGAGVRRQGRVDELLGLAHRGS